jgi:tRNA-specific 2-thiouridylase
MPARVIPLAAGRIQVQFDRPQRAISPGQAVVLYDDLAVLGGGQIIAE